MPETEHDAIGSKVGRGVVAKKLWIAKDEARAAVVIGIPDGERKNRNT